MSRRRPTGPLRLTVLSHTASQIRFPAELYYIPREEERHSIPVWVSFRNWGDGRGGNRVYAVVEIYKMGKFPANYRWNRDAVRSHDSKSGSDDRSGG